LLGCCSLPWPACLLVRREELALALWLCLVPYASSLMDRRLIRSRTLYFRSRHHYGAAFLSLYIALSRLISTSRLFLHSPPLLFAFPQRILLDSGDKTA
jgi:hypothetical protein